MTVLADRDARGLLAEKLRSLGRERRPEGAPRLRVSGKRVSTREQAGSQRAPAHCGTERLKRWRLGPGPCARSSRSKRWLGMRSGHRPTESLLELRDGALKRRSELIPSSHRSRLHVFGSREK